MAEELRIIIEADVTQAQAGLSALSSTAQKTGENIKSISPAATAASNSLNKIVPSSTSVNTSLKSVSNVIDQFSKRGVLSINVVEKSMIELKKIIKSTTDTNDIAKLTSAYDELGRKLKVLKSEGGLEQSLGGITTSARLAHTEMEGLVQSVKGIASGSERGVDALSNLVFTFERMRGVTGSTSGALAALGESLLGPAGIVLAITTLLPLLEPLVEGLFKSGKAFDETAISAANFKNELQSLNDFIDSTSGEIDFSSQIAKLKAQLDFGPGFESDIISKNIDVSAAQKKLENLNTVLDIQFKKLNSLLGNAATVLSKDGKELFDAFGGVPDLISDELIGKLSKNDQTFLNNLKKLSEDINKVNKERGDLTEQIEILNLQKQNQVHEKQLKEQKAFHDKQAREAQQFLDQINRQTIALAKEAEKVFAIPLTLRFDDTDLDLTKLNKARDVLAGIKDFTIKARIDIDLPDIKELPKEQVEKFFKNVPNALQDAIDKGLLLPHDNDSIEVPLEVIIPDAFSKDIEDALAQFRNARIELPLDLEIRAANGEHGVDFLVDLISTFKREVKAKHLKEEFENAINSAIQNISINAFTGIGDALGEALSGGDIGNAFKQFGAAIGEAVESLGKKIIALGVTTLLAKKAFQSFNPVLMIAAGVALVAIGAAFKNLISGGVRGFAAGGRPPVGKPSIVGEKGWEVFVPDTPGTIISHDKSVSLLSVRSVERSNEIKEYLSSQLISNHLKSIENRLLNVVYKISESSEKTNQSIIERFTAYTGSINSSITANNDKLTAYSYKLHESTDRTNNSIVSLRESFNSDATEKIVSSFKESLTDKSFKEYSEKTIQTFTNSISDRNHTTDTAVSKSESVQSPQIIHDLSNTTTSIKDAVASTVSTTIKSITASADKLTAYVYRLHDSISSDNKELQTDKERHSDKELSTATFDKLITSFRQTFTSDTATAVSNSLLTSLKESFKNSNTLVSSDKVTELITLFKESSSDNFRQSLSKETASIELYENVLKQVTDRFTASLSTDKTKELFTSHTSDSFERTGFDRLITSITVKDSERSDSDKVTSTFSDLHKLVSQFTISSSTELVKLFSSFKDSTSSAERFNSVFNTIKDSFAVNDSSVKETDNNTESFKTISASFGKIIATYTGNIKDSSFVSNNNTELIKLFTLLKDSSTSVSNSSGFERFNTVFDKTVSFKDSSKQSYDRLIERLFKDISSTDRHTTTNSYEGFAEKLKENLFKQSTFSHDKLISSATYDSLIEKIKTSTLSTDRQVSFTDSISSLNNSIEKLYSVARSDSSNNEILSDSSQSDRLSSSRIEKYFATQKDFIHDTASVIEKLVSSFVSTTGKDFSHKADVSSRSVISISDHSVKIADTFRQSLVESFSKLFSHSDSNESKEYFEQIRSIIQERGFERTLKELLRESFSESKIISSDKFIQSLLKDIYKTDTRSDKSTSDRSFRQLDLFESEKSITNDKSESFFKMILSNLTRSTDHSKQVFDKISERINERLTVNTIKSDSLTDKFHSVHVEKIVNNNFFSESMSSSKESLKSMSLEKFGKMFNIPAFAQGGAVFGPTLAILGEGFGISRSNPEFVGTASQLKGIQGGAFDVNVNVNGDISFDMGKLAVALNRQERSHIRTNGKKPF